MKIIIEKDFDTMSDTTKNILLGHMSQANRVNLSITAGRTPVKVYKKLVATLKNSPNYSNIHYYNFDEIPVPNQEEGITITDLRKLFLTPAAIPEEQIHPLTVENYQEQDKKIEAVGGLDAMLIGLGEDGHFCGNIPITTQFNKETYKITVSGNGPWFVPNMMQEGMSFVTMGPASIMKVKHLFLIVNDKNKAQILKEILTKPITEDKPASILQLHPNLTVILDEETTSQLN